MRPGGLTAWQVVLALVSGVGLGLSLVTVGTVAALPVLLWIGAGLIVAAPSLALDRWRNVLAFPLEVDP